MNQPLSESRVLLVDDQTLMLDRIRLILEPFGDIVFCGEFQAEDAVATAKAFGPTVILQDLMMPGIDGYELLARYREVDGLSNVPVVMLSAHDDADAKARCFSLGANGYLVKVPETVELVARLRYHSSAHRARADRDTAFHLLMLSQKELAAANFMLEKLNGMDPLTGVGNRRSFDATLHSEWLRAMRDSKPLALIMCDIDRFKSYNDAFGHVSGDFCIKRVAAALTEQLRRPADHVARYGGEEFAIILPDTDLPGALMVAESCRRHVENFSTSADPSSLRTPVTMSFGVASLVPINGMAAVHMIEGADRALLEAKAEGRNAVRAAA